MTCALEKAFDLSAPFVQYQNMFVAFFESIKYVGHLLPLSFLRLYVGYYFLQNSIAKFDGDYVSQPRLAAAINEYLPQSSAPLWYAHLLENFVVPHWQIFAYTISYCEFVIGISFLIGFLVRPVAFLGMFLSINAIFTSAPVLAELHQAYLAMFIIMAWMGAGRCLGFDYFFFKRNRGIWW